MIIDSNKNLLPQIQKILRDPKAGIIRTEEHPESGNKRTFIQTKGKIISMIYSQKEKGFFKYWQLDLNLKATAENIKLIQTPPKNSEFKNFNFTINN